MAELELETSRLEGSSRFSLPSLRAVPYALRHSALSLRLRSRPAAIASYQGDHGRRDDRMRNYRWTMSMTTFHVIFPPEILLSSSGLTSNLAEASIDRVRIDEKLERALVEIWVHLGGSPTSGSFFVFSAFRPQLSFQLPQA